MSILKNQKLLTLFGLSLLMSLTSPAQAQWPTLDMTAIKEGISSKIELVKQSKIVTEATQLGGKMNSTIGDAKSSMTKYAGDNIEKAKKKAEKLQKEKERLDKQKEKMDKLKEKAEKQKEKMEKAKKAMEDAKKMKEDAEKKIQEGKDAVNDAKSQVDEAKQMANDAKATAQGAISDAKSTVNDAKATAGDAVGTVKNKRDELQSDLGTSDNAGNGSTGSDSSFVDDYVADYEAGINSDNMVYEETPATPENSGKSPEDIFDNVNFEAFQGLHESQMSDKEILDVLQNPLTDEMVANMREKGVDEKTINSITFQKGLKALSGGASASETPAATDTAAPVSETAAPAAAVTANGQALKRQAFGRKAVSVKAQANEVVNTETAAASAGPAVSGSAKALRAVQGNNLRSTLDKAAVSAATDGNGTASASSLSAEANKAVAGQKTLSVPAAGRNVRTLSNTAVSATSGAAAASTEAVPATRGFRQRAIIKKDTKSLQQGVWLETLDTVKLAGYQKSETLMFGAEDSSEEIPDGVVNNGEYDETIIPEELVEYCKVGVSKLQDTSVMENCLKSLIKHQSDKDSQVAEQGKSIYTKVMADAVTSLVAESMQMKNTAANYEEKVLDKLEEDMGSSSTTRDDSGALAMTNKELQYQMNKMLTIYSAQLSLNALSQVGGFTKEDLGEDEEDGETDE